MKTQRFIRRSTIPANAAKVFNWHCQPGAFERLTPPWEHVELLEQPGEIKNGSRVTLRVKAGLLRKKWVSEHRDCTTPESGLSGEGMSQVWQFRDVQVSGPFACWNHTHRVESQSSDSCILEDEIEYALPLGPLVQWVAGRMVRSKLNRMFEYRHRITAGDIQAHNKGRGGFAMKLLVSGSTGLVGSALVPFLTTGGHSVIQLVRQRPTTTGGSADHVEWDPVTGKLNPSALEGIDAVVHLAGENIAAGRWTAKQKVRIRESRVSGTRLLAESLARLARPPKVFVCASAIGYYGNRGDTRLDEQSSSGNDFLAEVCRAWEASAQTAIDKGIRVVFLRFGMILSPAGGALGKMLTPFRLGVGGIVGDGQQYMSWIAMDDLIGAIHHAILDERLSGPVNLVSPYPVTNREFTKTLGRVLSRPTVFPLPALVARLVFGEMADGLLLSSTRVEPRRLLSTGYTFRYPILEDAFRHLLGR